MERIVLTTGGTGGHIFPALAVTDALRRRHPSVRMLFVGSLYGPEKDLVPKAGLDFVGLPVRGFLGRGLKAFGAGARMAWAVWKAVGIVRSFNPQAVVGFGSYAAFAPLMAARLCGIPTLLHEQNAVAGLSNRLLGMWVSRICVSLAQTQGFAPSRCVHTGNPVRTAVAQVGHMPHEFDSKHVLVLGGSQGARSINRAVMAALPRLHEAGISLRIQTGTADESMLRSACIQAGYAPTCVSAFIDDIAAAYAWADVVLCRAGASTVAELCAAGRPALFVPFPYATHDHQSFNAAALAQEGAALCLPDGEVTPKKLAAMLCELCNDATLLRRMAAKALGKARPHAADNVAAQIEALLTK